jgi:hypothetical protein
MPSLKIFTDMGKEEKLQFFQRCQDLLLETTPDSPYVLRQGDLDRNRSYFLDIFLRYQGLVYESDGIILLFNKLQYENKDQIYEHYRQRLFHPPDKNPNTYTVDFIASKLDPKILSEMEPYFKDEGMKWVCFLRGQKLSIFPAESFKNSVKQRFGLI